MLSFFSLAFGILCLSLAMSKHYKTWFRRPLREERRKVLSAIGWLFVVVSIILVPPLALNYVIWCCHLSLLILLQSMALYWKSRSDKTR